MDLTRRQVAGLFTALYAAGGALLLADYMAAGASSPGAHVPLAWHVYPIALAAQVVAEARSMPGPLDAVWPVPAWAVIPAYIIAVSICAGALAGLISGHANSVAKESGKEPERRL